MPPLAPEASRIPFVPSGVDEEPVSTEKAALPVRKKVMEPPTAVADETSIETLAVAVEPSELSTFGFEKVEERATELPIKVTSPPDVLLDEALIVPIEALPERA